ncbi:MAG: leucine-rich repeat domain-containing protein [Clostridiales bacterium]|nr:leucine-rich repeat domain-containing protein [Clostridiales bacterium]
MTKLFFTVLNMSIAASLLILAVILLRLILKKAPKWVFVLLWGLVGLRLVCPVFPKSAVSLVPDLGGRLDAARDTTVTEAPAAEPTQTEVRTPETACPTSRPTAVARPTETAAPETAAPETAAPGTAAPGTAAPVTETTGPEPAETDERSEEEPKKAPLFAAFTGRNTPGMLAAVWLAGAAAMTIWAAAGCISLKRRVALAVRISEGVYESENVASPFLFGLFKPRIYLPSGMDEKYAEFVSAHETAHVKRGDHIIKPLGFAILALHWFNPLVWLGYVLFCRDIELACDEKATRGFDPAKKADYTEALLSLSIAGRRVSACPLAFGESNLRERVKNVLNFKKPTIITMVAILLAAAALCACFMTDPKGKGNGPSPDPTETVAEAPTETPTPADTAIPTDTPAPTEEPAPTDTPVPKTTSEPVVFADPVFEAAVRAELKKEEGVIKSIDLKGVTMLYIDCENLGELTDLALLHELRDLYIWNAEGVDLTPVSRCTRLEGLSVCNSGLTDVSFAEGLTGLEYLDLSGNRISDLSPLAELDYVEDLILSSNEITDIAPLFDMYRLREVDLSWNNVSKEQAAELEKKLGEGSVNTYVLEDGRIAKYCADLDGDGKDEYLVVDLDWLQVEFKCPLWVLEDDGRRTDWIYVGSGHLGYHTYAVVEDETYGTCLLDYSPEFWGQTFSYRLLRLVNGMLECVFSDELRIPEVYDQEYECSQQVPALIDRAEAKAYEKRVNELFEKARILITTDRCGVMDGGLYRKDTGEIIYTRSAEAFMNGTDNIASGLANMPRSNVGGIRVIDGPIGYRFRLVFGRRGPMAEDTAVFADNAFETAFRAQYGMEGPISEAELLKLDKLKLTDTAFDSLEDLKLFGDLKELSLTNGKINNVYEITRFAWLEKLDLSGNKYLEELGSITWLLNLKKLAAADCRIKDVSGLSRLTALRELDLSGNGITDVSPLKSLTGLKKLYLTGNPIPEEQIEELHAALPDCRIFFD